MMNGMLIVFDLIWPHSGGGSGESVSADNDKELK